MKSSFKLQDLNLAYQSIHNTIISKMDKCQVFGDDGKEWNLKEKNYNALSIKHKK